MLIHGILRAYYIKCGKPACACANDRAKRHGPYWYLLWQQDGKLRRRYVPKAELEQVRAAVEARQAFVPRMREWRRQAMALAGVVKRLAAE
jgi:hypothetical protein